jgi:hypothetical protein
VVPTTAICKYPS